MFSIVIAPLYLRPDGSPISYAVFSTAHPTRSPWGFRVRRWWRVARPD